MINLIKQKHILISLLAFLCFMACAKQDPARHLNLGNWYLEKGLIDEAILEYREVSRMYSSDQSQLTREQFDILGKAHFKLAIAYTKKGWWEYALSEAKISFDVQPNKDSHDLVQLIEQKIALKNNS
tara:strand:+ start:1506 stop:1886 length:381 start_codon:yes stop_codon:yes gene_type:complete